MSETLIGTIVGAGVTLIATLFTQSTTYLVTKFKSKLEIKQAEYKFKRDNLHDAYKALMIVINHFPNRTPNEFLKYVEYPPVYTQEKFNSIITILDHKIEDYKEQLLLPNIKRQQKNDLDLLIHNTEYCKTKIIENRDLYFQARDKYNDFCKSEKVIFDLYAGQEVKNYLVEFEVVVNNLFIAGYSVENVDNPLENIIDVSRRNLIYYIRKDLGI